MSARDDSPGTVRKTSDGRVWVAGIHAESFSDWRWTCAADDAAASDEKIDEFGSVIVGHLDDFKKKVDSERLQPSGLNLDATFEYSEHRMYAVSFKNDLLGWVLVMDGDNTVLDPDFKVLQYDVADEHTLGFLFAGYYREELL